MHVNAICCAAYQSCGEQPAFNIACVSLKLISSLRVDMLRALLCPSCTPLSRLHSEPRPHIVTMALFLIMCSTNLALNLMC